MKPKPTPIYGPKRERDLWSGYYSRTKTKAKKRYKCDQCGELYDWDQLKTVSRLRNMQPPKRTCKKCNNALEKINQALIRRSKYG